MDPGAIWNSVSTGLLQGVTNIGISYATNELGLDPLLANLGFSAIATAINAGIQAATGGSQDVFKTIFETYEKNALTFLGYTEPGMPVSPWQQAAYLSQILDFSNIVQERGLVDALNAYGAGFFNAVAVNAIVQSGTTLGKYFDDKLKTGQYTLRTIKGKELAAVDTPIQNDGGKTIALFERVVGDDGTPYWKPVGKEEAMGNGQFSLSIGEIGVDPYGKLGYTDADLATIFNSDIQYQRIRDGQQAYVEIRDLQNNILLVIEPTAGGHYNVYNSLGEYESARVLSTITDMKLDITNGTPNNVTIGQGAGAISINMSGKDFSSLLFSAVENGKIVMDKLIKQTTWLGLVGIAEAAENITSPLTGVANLAINKINSGESINLANLASASTWQSIFATSGSMSDWANTATLLFADSISPILAPGTKMLMNIFGSEAFRKQLNNQAAETFNGYNLFEQLAAAALGNPGSGTIIEQIGTKNFWEGIKSAAELTWNNRTEIISEANKFAITMLSPTIAQLDTPVGQEFIKEARDFFCLGDFTPTVSDIDPITKTLKIDPALNYGNIMQQPISGIMDWITLAQFGNIRWNMASQRAAQEGPRISSYITNGSLKGFSISGINDDGAKLDSLTKQLSPLAISSFGITNSAGISTLIRTTMRPERLIITNTQEKRGSLEGWLQSMNYSQDKVLLVDVAQDLPYRPTDLAYLSPADIISNLATPANIVTTNISNLLQDNAYNDYSSNPNNKYIYMRILSGPGVDRDITPELFPHTAAVVGALDPNAKYTVTVNGRIIRDITLTSLYGKFLRGEDI